MSDTSDLNREIQDLQHKLNSKKAELEDVYRKCPHNHNENHWETKYDPIYKEAYTIPGDKPGTMGVDWRGPTHVPSQTTKRWKRNCTLCGKIEYTERIEPKVTETPKW